MVAAVGRAAIVIGGGYMKERAAYQAASAGEQSVESNGPTVQPPISASTSNGRITVQSSCRADARVTLLNHVADRGAESPVSGVQPPNFPELVVDRGAIAT